MPIARRLQLIGCATVMAALAPPPLAAQMSSVPAVPPPAAAPSAATLEWELDFLIITIENDMVESAASTLALRRATDKNLRAFAAHMVDDHHHIRLHVMRAARALHLPVPVTLSGRAQTRLARLERTADGEAFDDAYVELMLRVHRETMAAHLAFAANPGRPSLVQASREARTRVQEHIDRLEKVVLSLQPPALVQDTPPLRPVSPWPEDAAD